MNFKNKILEVWSYVTNTFCSKKTFNIPKEYKIVHQDNFDKVDTNFWNVWDSNGEYLTNNLRVYWDDRHCFGVKDNTLEISVEYRPKSIPMLQVPLWQRMELNYRDSKEGDVPRVIYDGNKDSIGYVTDLDSIEIPYCCGFLMSKVGFKYGIFKVEAILPKGNGLWPSFWTYAMESWPPEIDIFEGYTREDEIKPNVHYGNNHQNHVNYGSTSIKMDNKSTEWHEYVGWWEKDFIKIYYDGRLVYEVTDRKVLDWFDSTNQKIIMNCNVENFKEGTLDMNIMKSPLKFRNFKIYQK